MPRNPPHVALLVLAAIGGCMAVPQALGREVADAAIGATAVLFSIVLGSFVYQARRHHRLASGMARLAHPGAVAGQSVEFVPGLGSPLVAGLWRPRIYCADDLATQLDAEEVEAVILHERHHVVDRAPLRIVLLAALSPILGRLARGGAWLERERARLEIAADRSALAAGASRPAIAGALLKLSASPPPVGALGFATATDLRIRALLDEPTGLDRDRPLAAMVAAGLFVLAACVVAYLV